MRSTRWRSVGRVATRFGASAVLLVLVARFLNLDQVVGRLGALDLRWVGLGLIVSVLQVLVSAWRWRFTAARLGIDLGRSRAFSEYYLGIFLNQVLPGGVAGDVSRAWRHARDTPRTGTAVWAVVLERASAQTVMTTVAVLCFLALPLASLPVRSALVAGAATIAVTVATLVLARRQRTTNRGLGGGLWADTRRAVLAPDAVSAQLSSALVLVASYVAVYVIAARAIGIDTPTTALLPLVPPVLMTMLIPVTVAGWGLREGAAAGLWGLVGLGAEDGAAISVAYGLIVLVSSLPGLLTLLRRGAGGRGRTGRLGPTEIPGTRAESPDPATRSDRA